jgi:hypothetical protein
MSHENRRTNQASKDSRVRALSFSFLFAAALLLAGNEVGATAAPITVGEVSAPPGSGIDEAGLRITAERETRQIDISRLPIHRRVVVSLALRPMTEGPVSCIVNAVVRDAKTGAMIAIIEATARGEGSASKALRKEVAHAVVRRAVRRIPQALGASHETPAEVEPTRGPTSQILR